jgi:HEAT repeats
MPDPLQPQDSASESLKIDRAVEPPQPSEAEVVNALLEIEESTKKTQSDALPVHAPTQRSWFSRNTEVILYFSLAIAVCVLVAWGLDRAAKKLFSTVVTTRSAVQSKAAIGQRVDPVRQAAAERVLQRLAAGDRAAVDQVLGQSDSWTGKTARTQTTDQAIDTAINFNDLQVRAGGIQAQLALDGVPRDASGLKMLEQAVGNPSQRAWALWMLGAIGNRGVDPVHTAKIIGAYLDDPVVNNRAAAVNGLALLATDETVPMLLDRFRNDPSPVVQDRAACGLAESGMYTHQQRMVAAASLVGWLDDSLLTTQQRIWTVQALHDISGKSFGTDTAAWHRWYDGTR